VLAAKALMALLRRTGVKILIRKMEFGFSTIPNQRYLEMESEDMQQQKRMEEDRDACYMGFINDIQEFAGRDLGKSKALLQGCRDVHRKTRETKQGADSAAKAKEEKGVRRAAVRKVKLAAKAKGE
jgi:hypothetical protein